MNLTTGLRDNSYDTMVLNAGVLIRDPEEKFDDKTTTQDVLDMIIKYVETEATAKTVGATRGGGTFSVTSEIRDIEADGKRNPHKKGKVFEGVTEVKMTGTLLEITPGNIVQLLPVATKNGGESTNANISITMPNRAKNADMNFANRMVWIGDYQDGSFLVIEMFNVLNNNGLSITYTDKGEATMPFELIAHQADMSEGTAPFNMHIIRKLDGVG